MNIFKETLNFFAEIASKKLVIYQLARQDFRNRYLGSTLGFVWTFIQPLVMVLILWFVFSVVFNVQSVQGVAFSSYLLIGLAGWHFFSESLSMSTNVFQEYAFMVKKVNFQIAILPAVKILSSLIVHGIFLFIVMAILLCTRVPFSIYWFQTIYYTAALVILLLGLSWMTSSLNVFVKDVAHIVNIFLQLGFWVTPVVWPVARIPEKYHVFLKLNPLFYIVEGYRRSFLFHTPLWQDYPWTIYFWTVTLTVLVLGIVIFRKLKPHFADVL